MLRDIITKLPFVDNNKEIDAAIKKQKEALRELDAKIEQIRATIDGEQKWFIKFEKRWDGTERRKCERDCDDLDDAGLHGDT